MKALDLVQELADTVLQKFKEFDGKLKKVEESIPEPYDDTKLQHSVEEVKELIPERYDDSELIKSIPEPYNDEEIKEKLVEIEEKMITEVPELPEPYNDEEIKEKLVEIEEKMITEVPELPEPYNDEEIKERLEKIQDTVDAKIKAFEEQVEKTFEEVSRKVTYEMPTPYQYESGSAVEKGAFILWKNALWLNRMDDNDTTPSLENKSYICLIPAPKAPEHKGLYKEDESYGFNDIVMKDNASWIRVDGGSDDLPGEGWKLLAKGIKGRKGEKGESVKVEFEAEKSLEELNDRVMILEAKNVDNNE